MATQSKWACPEPKVLPGSWLAETRSLRAYFFGDIERVLAAEDALKTELVVAARAAAPESGVVVNLIDGGSSTRTQAIEMRH